MSIKAVIIDDEIMARNLLKGMLEEFCTDVEVLDLCHDLPSGVLSIRKNKPNIVFLDIEMPGYSGLEIMNFFSEDEVDFSIIFTTSYNEYAIQAFKLSAIDYLLKPIEPADLNQAVELFKKQSFKTNLDSLRINLGENKIKKIPINTTNSVIYIELDSVLYMKAEGSYTNIFLLDGTTILASKGLKHFEDLVTGEKNFMRTHKSFIVNVNYVNEFLKSGGYFLKINEHEISISNDKVQAFQELMKL